MKTQPIDYHVLQKHATESFKIALTNFNRRKLIENLAYLLALETGLRVSDLLNLKFSDKGFNVSGDNWEFKTTIQKTGKDQISPISSQLNEYLELYKECLKSLNLEPQNAIFYNYLTKGLYSRQWLHKQFKIVGDSLGFQNFGVHSIRKASGILMANEGGLSLAQNHLGHKRATTTDAYLGLTNSTAAKLRSKIINRSNI